jgi:hypothetical protein
VLRVPRDRPDRPERAIFFTGRHPHYFDRKVKQYHLRMKNEQFGNPLSRERLAEIDQRKVQPLEGVDFSPIGREREDLAAYAL